MARIRSFHPDLWADEDFAGLSPAARILYLGIQSHADDQGVFRWKPITLKNLALPQDDVDPEELLRELQGADLVRRFTHDSSDYGALRGFRKHQKTNRPSAQNPLPEGLTGYVKLRAGDEEWGMVVSDSECSLIPFTECSGVLQSAPSARARARPSPSPSPSTVSTPSPSTKARRSRQPTREQAEAAVGEHLLLTRIEGLPEAVGEWRDAIRAHPKRSVWASLPALHRHLAYLEAHPAEALAIVRYATDNAYMTPQAAHERIRQETHGTRVNGHHAPARDRGGCVEEVRKLNLA